MIPINNFIDVVKLSNSFEHHKSSKMIYTKLISTNKT